MTNGNNVTQAKHLESTAAATKRFVLAEILDVTNAVAAELANVSGGGVLDTVASTVNGGMWYEVESNIPTAVKLKHGAHTLTLTPEINNISPQLTVTPTSLNIAAGGSITASVSRLGTGTVTVSSNESSVVPTYSNGTITVPYSYSAATAVITVSVAASYGFLADSKTFTVTMGTASPNLTVTPSANSTDGDDITATVTYNGGGTISVSSNNANVTPTYSNGTITVPYYAFTADTNVTITVSVAQSGNYTAQSQTFTVLYEEAQELDPQLTLSPSSQTISSGTDATINVSYLGNGTVTVSAQGIGASHSPSYSNGVITLPFNHNEAVAGGSVTVTAGLSASPPYTAATATAMVFMKGTADGGDVIVKLFKE